MRSEEAPIRGAIRQRGFRRVSHGLFLVERPGLGDDDEFVRDLEAWLLVLPASAVFTHLTAARLLGWRLPSIRVAVPVFAAVHGGERRPRRPGLICSRLVASESAAGSRLARGLPVDEPEEILLRAARDLSHVDLVVLIDSARALGHLDEARMSGILSSRRPGTRALAAAYSVSSPRAESPGETLLRLFHRVMEIDVEPQVDVTDPDGRVIARADLLVKGTKDIHEYDGAGHRSMGQQRSDLRRERALHQAGYVRRGYVLDDLLNHAGVVIHELDRAYGRAHQPARASRWRRIVEESTYAEAGRTRLLNRWRRSMGVTDWS